VTPKRDFLSFKDISRAELLDLLELAEQMRAGQYRETPLRGKAVGLIFSKSSTRTRVSFEVGVHQLGGQPLFLSSDDIQLGRGEPLRDTARVMSRFVDGLMIRTHAHADVEELARYASVPVINGLTDLLHPCQVLADLLTIRQEFGEVSTPVVAWIGDGNNMANSWLEAAAMLGFELRLACPPGYQPDPGILAEAQSRTNVVITSDPTQAAIGANVVTTDVWASMGHETEAEQRRAAFQGYCVDAALMRHASPDAIVLHCLPAHRGEEISDEVLEGPQSRVLDEAENRLHVQKSLMVRMMS
jgi:ornithine carbamoyltransferase